MKFITLSGIWITVITTVFTGNLIAQTVPVGRPLLEDFMRRSQLVNGESSNNSYLIRPVSPLQDSTKNTIKLLPFYLKSQFNSDHPEGINDGAMIPARGIESYVSAGVYTKFHCLSLQLQPEFIYTENKNFDGFSDALPNSYWSTWYNLIESSIDNPEKFGNKAYHKFYWGQSSLRLNSRNLSIGLSTENLWWGPGYKNSLIMTNNAPGFMHISLNTTQPINTFIGSFEAQLVCGRLLASGFSSFDTLQLTEHGITSITKPNDSRYLNGGVLVYQPKWLNGLSLGVARSFISYWHELGSLNSYLPVISPFFKKVLGNAKEDAIVRDQLASVFFRWKAPRSGMEIYGEYGREDHGYDLTDLILTPDYSSAYIFGFRKLTPLNCSKKSFLDFQFEQIDLSKTRSSSYRNGNAAGWYHHYQILDGYTHMGQNLGSGIGMSSNMQWVSLAWVQGLNRFGIEGKRLAHDEDFWAVVSKDYRTHWVDVGGGIFADWDYKNVLINAKVQTIGSINYQHLYAPIPNDPAQWWGRGPIRYNVHAELGLTYLF